MRTTILTLGFILGLVRVSMAMPVAPPPVLSNAVEVHGCHHYYAQDMSGWHRHDKNCDALRGLVSHKSRNPAKS